jgi:hypothetical protein
VARTESQVPIFREAARATAHASTPRSICGRPPPSEARFNSRGSPCAQIGRLAILVRDHSADQGGVSDKSAIFCGWWASSGAITIGARDRNGNPILVNGVLDTGETTNEFSTDWLFSYPAVPGTLVYSDMDRRSKSRANSDSRICGEHATGSSARSAISSPLTASLAGLTISMAPISEITVG